MFDPLDHDRALDRAVRITPAYVRDLLDGYVEADLIDDDERQAMLRQLQPLLDLIRSTIHGERFWELFQQHFGFAGATPKIVPMNAANLCPEPTGLINAANLLRSAYNRNVAQQVRTADGLRVRQLAAMRARLARSLGLSDPHDLALIRNSSEGNNAINAGYRHWTRTDDPAQLDTVIVWDENHPTNLEAWRLRRDAHRGIRHDDDAPRPGDPFRLILVHLDREDTAETIARKFTDHIDARTRFVTFSETSNGNGMRIPESAIEAIWNHVAGNGHHQCHIHIDGTMSWGARPVNLGRPHCHSFVSSAHKWFLGPKETAIFYMHKDKVTNFQPSIFAYDYRIQIGHWDAMPANALRFEMLGQRDDVNLITLDLTQVVWDALMPRNPYGRVRHLATRLKGKLLDSGWRLRTPLEDWKSWGIVRVEAPSHPPRESLYDWMYDPRRPHRFGGSGGGRLGDETFRLCPHIYNTEADIDRAVESMNLWRSP